VNRLEKGAHGTADTARLMIACRALADVKEEESSLYRSIRALPVPHLFPLFRAEPQTYSEPTDSR
jgi:hypothetical protein